MPTTFQHCGTEFCTFIFSSLLQDSCYSVRKAGRVSESSAAPHTHTHTHTLWLSDLWPLELSLPSERMTGKQWGHDTQTHPPTHTHTHTHTLTQSDRLRRKQTTNRNTGRQNTIHTVSMKNIFIVLNLYAHKKDIYNIYIYIYIYIYTLYCQKYWVAPLLMNRVDYFSNFYEYKS